MRGRCISILAAAHSAAASYDQIFATCAQQRIVCLNLKLTSYVLTKLHDSLHVQASLCQNADRCHLANVPTNRAWQDSGAPLDFRQAPRTLQRLYCIINVHSTLSHCIGPDLGIVTIVGQYKRSCPARVQTCVRLAAPLATCTAQQNRRIRMSSLLTVLLFALLPIGLVCDEFMYNSTVAAGAFSARLMDLGSSMRPTLSYIPRGAQLQVRAPKLPSLSHTRKERY